MLVRDHHQSRRLGRARTGAPAAVRLLQPVGEGLAEHLAQRGHRLGDAPGRHRPVEQLGVLGVRKKIETGPVRDPIGRRGQGEAQVVGGVDGGELQHDGPDERDRRVAVADNGDLVGVAEVDRHGHRRHGAEAVHHRGHLGQQIRVLRLHRRLRGRHGQREPRHVTGTDPDAQKVLVAAPPLPQPARVAHHRQQGGRVGMHQGGGVAGVVGALLQVAAHLLQIVQVPGPLGGLLGGPAAAGTERETESGHDREHEDHTGDQQEQRLPVAHHHHHHHRRHGADHRQQELQRRRPGIVDQRGWGGEGLRLGGRHRDCGPGGSVHHNGHRGTPSRLRTTAASTTAAARPSTAIEVV